MHNEDVSVRMSHHRNYSPVTRNGFLFEVSFSHSRQMPGQSELLTVSLNKLHKEKFMYS
jgi:hypothetical protein